MAKQDIGVHILRLGLSAVFLWFGFSQLFDSLSWVAWVPEWAVTLFNIPPAIIVLGNGLFEVVFGSLLALGFFTRVVAIFLGIHIAAITIDIGPSPIGVRDFGLTCATFALAFLGTQKAKEDIRNGQ